MKRTNCILMGAVCAALLLPLAPAAFGQAAPAGAATKSSAKPGAKQRTFASADEAAKALAEAARAKNVQDLLAVVGPASSSWLFSGDKVADANDWAKFVASYDEKNRLEMQGDGRAILDVGNDDWPFPAPIVKHGSTWSFDANAGREEILNRRVGRNELDAIQTLLAIVDAQREYAATDADEIGRAHV